MGMQSMRYLKFGFGAVLVASILSGCTTAGRQSTGVGIGDLALNELKRHEYVLMDTVEGVGKTTTVLGITFPLFHRQTAWTVSANGFSGPLRDDAAKAKLASGRAMYDALSKVPSADAVFTMSKTIEEFRIPFIYRVNTATLKAKGVRIKSDEELDSARQTGKTITITSEGDLEIDVDD